MSDEVKVQEGVKEEVVQLGMFQEIPCEVRVGVGLNGYITQLGLFN
jgi:hypothetical protein